MSVMARKIVRDRAREVREVAPDEAADDDWPWLLERIAEDNLSLLARVEELEGITGTSFRECVRNLMRSRGVKRQKELVGRMREAGSPITENALSGYLLRKRTAPRHFFRCLAEVLELTRVEKSRVAWAYVWRIKASVVEVVSSDEGLSHTALPAGLQFSSLPAKFSEARKRRTLPLLSSCRRPPW